MASSNFSEPFRPAQGSVFFPLASNAHALVTGASVASVRARLKMSSLLYNQVLIESGQMHIQAGPDGSQTWRSQPHPDIESKWQTPRARKNGQKAPFSLAVAREAVEGAPAIGPYHQVLHSETSIFWMPTFEPFKYELPSRCDWVCFGEFRPINPELQKLADHWKHLDENESLIRLVPKNFVRSSLIDHVSRDLVTGASANLDISIDSFHGKVIRAYLAGDDQLRPASFVLPFLIPRVGDLPWDDVKSIRKLKALARLREILREVEMEVREVASSGRDLEAAVHAAFNKKVRHASAGLEGIRPMSSMALAELVVGVGAADIVTGLTHLGPLGGPLVAAGATATVMSGLHLQKLLKNRREQAWLGVMDAITVAAQQG